MIMSAEECKSYFKIKMCLLFKRQNELEKVYQVYFSKVQIGECYGGDKAHIEMK